jgi:hypothetical protein
MRFLTTALTLTLAAPLFSAELGNPSALVAHEWGTFTSVAGADGNPVQWAPLTGPPDLPCFVRVGDEPKAAFSGLVRMETPVLYFYSARPVQLSVDVKFPLGTITEWYPNATHVQPGHLTWDSVQLLPGEHPQLPTAKGDSRYFAARNTDSTPLEIGAQAEKMIFYRGVGGFAVPLRPKFTADGKIEIRNVSENRIPIVILFENRNGKLGYRVSTDVQQAVMDPPQLNASVAELRQTIVKALIDRGGLYPKEAQAMLDTWHDSWFEEGMRLIYILPQQPVDAVLPLTIQPEPTELARAFVGRIEMLSPATKQETQAALSSGDSLALQKLGRFLEPFATQLGATSNAAYRQAAENIQSQSKFGACVQ